MTLRSTLYPLLKDKVHGWLGDTIDTLAVVSTLIGVATSLGLGVLQLNAGLTFLFDAPDARWFQSVLIGLITLAATLSVVSGLSNGVRRLSEANIFIAGSLLLAVLFFGPTLEILTGYLKNWGYYLSGLLHHSTWTGGTETERDGSQAGPFSIGLGGLHGHLLLECSSPRSPLDEPSANSSSLYLSSPPLSALPG